MRLDLGISVSSNLSTLGANLSNRDFSTQKKANLIALLIMLILVYVNWLSSSPDSGLKFALSSIAVVACFKFITIYLVFMETHRAHFFWIASGFIYGIAVTGLVVVQF